MSQLLSAGTDAIMEVIGRGTDLARVGVVLTRIDLTEVQNKIAHDGEIELMLAVLSPDYSTVVRPTPTLPSDFEVTTRQRIMRRSFFDVRDIDIKSRRRGSFSFTATYDRPRQEVYAAFEADLSRTVHVRFFVDTEGQAIYVVL